MENNPNRTLMGFVALIGAIMFYTGICIAIWQFVPFIFAKLISYGIVFILSAFMLSDVDNG